MSLSRRPPEKDGEDASPDSKSSSPVLYTLHDLLKLPPDADLLNLTIAPTKSHSFYPCTLRTQLLSRLTSVQYESLSSFLPYFSTTLSCPPQSSLFPDLASRLSYNICSYRTFYPLIETLWQHRGVSSRFGETVGSWFQSVGSVVRWIGSKVRGAPADDPDGDGNLGGGVRLPIEETLSLRSAREKWREFVGDLGAVHVRGEGELSCHTQEEFGQLRNDSGELSDFEGSDQRDAGADKGQRGPSRGSGPGIVGRFGEALRWAGELTAGERVTLERVIKRTLESQSPFVFSNAGGSSWFGKKEMDEEGGGASARKEVLVVSLALLFNFPPKAPIAMLETARGAEARANAARLYVQFLLKYGFARTWASLHHQALRYEQAFLRALALHEVERLRTGDGKELEEEGEEDEEDTIRIRGHDLNGEKVRIMVSRREFVRHCLQVSEQFDKYITLEDIGNDIKSVTTLDLRRLQRRVFPLQDAVPLDVLLAEHAKKVRKTFKSATFELIYDLRVVADADDDLFENQLYHPDDVAVLISKSFDESRVSSDWSRAPVPNTDDPATDAFDSPSRPQVPRFLADLPTILGGLESAITDVENAKRKTKRFQLEFELAQIDDKLTPDEVSQGRTIVSRNLSMLKEKESIVEEFRRQLVEQYTASESLSGDLRSRIDSALARRIGGRQTGVDLPALIQQYELASNEPTSDYRPLELLSVGQGRIVYAEPRKEDPEDLVDVSLLKLIDLRRNTDLQRRRIVNEIRLLSSFRHPNIATIKSVFVSEDDTTAHLEYGHIGVTLLHWLKERTSLIPILRIEDFLQRQKDFVVRPTIRPRKEVRTVFYKLLSSLAYLHQTHQVAHCDLAFHSVMILSGTLEPIMVDFGCAHSRRRLFSLDLGEGFVRSDPVAKRYFPVGESPGMESDVWSFGKLLYEAIVDFRHDVPIDESSSTMAFLPPGEVPELTPVEVDLLTRLLHPDPHLRISSLQALQHPFFKRGEAVRRTPRLGQVRLVTRRIEALRDVTTAEDGQTEVRIDRSNPDSYIAVLLDLLAVSSFAELLKKFHVKFANEDGIDAGGLRRDLYGHLCRQIRDAALRKCDGGIWYFKELANSDEMATAMLGFGLLLVKALMHEFPLDLRMPCFFYDFLLHGKEWADALSLDELTFYYCQFQADAYKTLERDILCKNVDDLDPMERECYVYFDDRDREQIVSETNKHLFVEWFLRHHLYRGKKLSLLEACYRGFRDPPMFRLPGGLSETLDTMNGCELEVLLGGPDEVDAEVLISQIKFPNERMTPAKTLVKNWLLRFLRSCTNKYRKLFIEICSSLTNIPASGRFDRDLTMRFRSSNQRSFQGHTCSYSLELDYGFGSYEQFSGAMTEALDLIALDRAFNAA